MNVLNGVKLLTALELIYLILAIDVHLVSAENSDGEAFFEAEYIGISVRGNGYSVAVKLYSALICNRLLLLVGDNLGIVSLIDPYGLVCKACDILRIAEKRQR